MTARMQISFSPSGSAFRLSPQARERRCVAAGGFEAPAHDCNAFRSSCARRGRERAKHRQCASGCRRRSRSRRRRETNAGRCRGQTPRRVCLRSGAPSRLLELGSDFRDPDRVEPGSIGGRFGASPSALLAAQEDRSMDVEIAFEPRRERRRERSPRKGHAIWSRRRRTGSASGRRPW